MKRGREFPGTGRGGEFARGERGRRGRGDFQRGGRDRGRGRGPPGGRGTPVRRQDGETAISRALHGLSLSVPPPPPLTPDNMALARRPDSGGTGGKPFDVLVNYFPMTVGVQTVYHYDVTIRQVDERGLSERDVAPTGQQQMPMNLCRALVDECAEKHNWPPGWVFDGKKNMYAASEIFRREKTTYELDRGDGNNKFEIGIRHASTINLLDIQRYLQRGDIAVPRDAIQSLEVCLRFSAARNPSCHIAGRALYFDDPRTNTPMTGGADLWMGYYQGVKLVQKGLVMNVEMACQGFLRRMPLLEFLEDAMDGRPVRQWSQLDREVVMRRIRGALTNVLIRPTHRRGVSKKIRCVGITKDSAADAEFTLKDGTSMTVERYFKDKYGPLQYPWLPCVDISKGKNTNYLPMEVCEVAPGQRLQKYTEQQTREMMRVTVQKPEDRMRSIIGCLEKARISDDPAAQSFGIEVAKQMLRVPGRVLPQPYLDYTSPECMNTGEQGSWNLRDVQFLRPGKIESWAMVSSMEKRQVLREGPEGLKDFTQSLLQMLQSVGLELPNQMPPLIHRGTNTTEDALKSAVEEALNQYGKPPDLVLYLLPDKTAAPYQEVKRISERDLGIVTQCFVALSAGIGCRSKGRDQYLANLAMKINHKVGGVNTQITNSIGKAFPVLGLHQNKPFIVFGADVTHPAGFDPTEPSVGAVVASMDPYLLPHLTLSESEWCRYLGQFAARVVAMGHREEKMSMHEAMVELFKQFFQRNGVRPEAVFFYRDGVSEGQFQEIMEHEYAEMKKACHALSPQYNPPISLIVVQKNHRTRLFPADPVDGDFKGNVKPGTCVDTGITDNYAFDFYLNSHSGIQGGPSPYAPTPHAAVGTNKPAHYYVLVDENGFGSDGLQLFSYWMCYLYCRCTRSVSYAPPAYYAHLAALHGRYLVGTHSDSSSEGSNGKGRTTMFHQDLNQRMFFV